MEWKLYEKQINDEVNKKILKLEEEYQKIKAGRPNPNILNSLVVNFYDSKMKIIELANVQVINGKQLLVKPYDKQSLKPINEAILKANLNLNPIIDSDTIKINFPSPTEETRKLSVKKAKEILEDFKNQIRNLRKTIHTSIKNDEELTKDELINYEKQLDNLIKKVNLNLENIFSSKEKELMII